MHMTEQEMQEFWQELRAAIGRKMHPRYKAGLLSKADAKQSILEAVEEIGPHYGIKDKHNELAAIVFAEFDKSAKRARQRN